MDRLEDGFWTENEILQFNTEDVAPSKPKWNSMPQKKLIATYRVYNNDGFTGKIVITATDSPVDTQEALQNLWADTGLTIQIGEFSEEMYGWQEKMNALQIVLDKYQYIPKFTDVPGVDRVYNYRKWMDELIQ